MKKILMKNATIITHQGELLKAKNIWIEEDKISSITDFQDDTEQMYKDVDSQTQVIDCQGLYVTPGLVNLHCHAAMSIFRGIAEDVSADAWFNEWIWPYESKMEEEDIYLGTRLAAAEMIDNGVTAFADHYFGQDQVLKAVLDTGIRADIAPTVFGLSEDYQKNLSEVRDFIIKNRDISSRVSLRMGPHSPYTCPQPYLKEIADAAKELGVGMHLHISETREQVEASLAALGKTPFQVAFESGCFDVNCLVAHGLWVEESDLPYLSKDTWFAFCPKTYMKLAMGNGHIYDLKDQLLFSFGSDGAASSNSLSSLEQARYFALIGKYIHDDPAIFATSDIWKALMAGHDALPFHTGKVEVGYDADLVVWDFNQIQTFPVYHPLTALLYSSDARNVKYTMVAGQFLKYEGRLCMDQESLLTEVKSAHKKLLARGKGKAAVTY